MLKERVKTLRKSKGWSQVKLAKEAGVSQQTIGKIETGKASESRKLPSIAAALGVSVEDLTQGETPVSDSGAKQQAAPEDRVWQNLLELWPRLDRTGRRHVLRSAENELVRLTQHPSQAPSGRQKIPKKKRALKRLSSSPIPAY